MERDLASVRLTTKQRAWCLTACILVLMFPLAEAKTRCLGWLEWAWLQPDHVKIKTKLDTGAKTSSIHAVDIEEFDVDGEPWLRFRIPLASRPDDSNHRKDLVLERRVLRETKIKDHTRQSAQRYVVDMEICIGGKTFVTQMSLADRSRFNYPLLLGRSALRGWAIIDPANIFTASRSCSLPDD